MASPQIGMASTSSPFGHALRDQWSKDSNATTFQNLKDFVDSISGQPNKISQNDVHNKNANDEQTDHADLWVHIPSYKVNENNNGVPQSNKCDDQMAKAKTFKFSPVSPVQIKVSKPNNKGGVSSLVRRWKDFEAEAKNSANNSPLSSSRAISVDSIMIPNDSFHSHDNNDNESLVGMRSETRSMSEEDTFGDSESDASEKELTRVVDIIRKLTSTGGVHEENGNTNDQEPYSPRRTSLDLEQQRSCVSPGAGSQRFRGRQVSGDLWRKQQRDRHSELQGLVERNAVSKFSQKAPIQAMLRLQLLRHRAHAKDTRISNSTSLEVNRLSESSIKQLRERFKTVSQDSAPRWNSPKKKVEDLSQVQKSTSAQGEGTQKNEVAVTKFVPEREVNTKTKESVCKSGIVDGEATSNDKNKKEEEKNILQAAYLNSEFLQERTNEENTSCSLRLSAETSVSSTAVKEAYSTEGDEKRLQPSGIDDERMSCSFDLRENLQPNETIHDRSTESVNTQQDWDEECSSRQYLSESEHGWVSDVSQNQIGWEELHSDYGQQSDSMQDWIGDISRPRTEWEGLRQERYQEMLDPFRQKEDIRHLLESKSVSSFLSSGLRDRIDRLMICRTQQQLSRTGSLTDEQVVEVEESEYKVEVEHDVVGDVIKEIEEGGNAGYDQDNEYESQVKQQYEEFVEHKDQTSHSPQSTSRKRNHDPETSDCFDQVEFSPLQHDSSQNSYSQESQTYSMANRCSIEIQLIYELRGHMEKLHQEMSEIRKSINSCMNKQLKLQRSVGRNVVATLGHSGSQNRGRHSTQQKGLINKSMCCICYDVRVDSLLYRCGHMCTCFKCAHELQRGSGSCPVCQAPIVDVVRTQANF